MKPVVRMLASAISHMPLLFVWRDSGVTDRHGFKLAVDISNMRIPGQPVISMRERAPKLLDGTYDFLSGLHIEPYQYRARGDKRFVYLAQAQNDWDDRVVARENIQSPQDLEGKRVIATSNAPCVMGNLRHTLELAGVDLGRVDFVTITKEEGSCRGAVEAVARGDAAAANVDIPFDVQAAKRGLHTLETPRVPVIHNVTICANREWVRENEDTTLAFLRSMVDAIAFFRTEKSKVCEILERELAPLIRLEGPDEIERLHEGWAGLLSPKPYPHPIAVWNVYNLDVAHDPEVNWIGPFEIWDTSYLRAIDDSDYIDELYADPRLAVNPAINPRI